MGANFQSILEPFLSLLFPNRCYFCGSILEGTSCICDRCLAKIEIIHPPYCGRCGAPLYHDKVKDGKCIQCEDLRFHFQKNESLGVFTGDLRELIHLYKFEGRRSLYRTFTTLLIRYKREYIESHDLLIPVPLTTSRYAERGFNQSSLIADELGKQFPITYLEDCLKRTGVSKPQSSIQSIEERLKNLNDRFFMRERYRKGIREKAILIFDDVLTTGATSSACAQTLYDVGARRVDILTIARAIKE